MLTLGGGQRVVNDMRRRRSASARIEVEAGLKLRWLQQRSGAHVTRGDCSTDTGEFPNSGEGRRERVLGFETRRQSSTGELSVGVSAMERQAPYLYWALAPASWSWCQHERILTCTNIVVLQAQRLGHAPGASVCVTEMTYDLCLFADLKSKNPSFAACLQVHEHPLLDEQSLKSQRTSIKSPL